ncbi:hypothetical protein O181_086248 [Austropuccinia psidii MF-1]|uniref:NADH-ubiquinone oxidoreductase 9.5 kDa subunit n=1 Tax=Austropuccinia psidii MF-1 TaxID=1389203 RepID=A0A9Q3IM35_9BASI|nr:hypothetical protein [Austropuccinia psidii MF-1]
MASAGISRFNYFRRTQRYLQHQAHENPAIFWSLAIGFAGPVLLAVVPPVRRNYFGYVPPEQIPMSYPLCKDALMFLVPQRPRDKNLSGYDDQKP